MPEEGLRGLFQVPWVNDSAGAVTAFFLSDEGPPLHPGSCSFYPETNFSSRNPDCGRGFSLRYIAHKQVRHLLGTNTY